MATLSFCRRLCHVLALSLWGIDSVVGNLNLLGKLVDKAEEQAECKDKAIWGDCFSGFNFPQSQCIPYDEDATPDLPPSPFHWKAKFNPSSSAPYCIECCSNARLEYAFEDETWDLRCTLPASISELDVYEHDFWFPVRDNSDTPNRWDQEVCMEKILRCPIKRPPPLQRIELYAPDLKRGKVFGNWRIYFNSTWTEPIDIDAPAKIKDEITPLLEGKSVESIFESAMGIDVEVSRFTTANGFIWQLTFGASIKILSELDAFEEAELFRGLNSLEDDTQQYFKYDGNISKTVQGDIEMYPNVTILNNMTSIEDEPDEIRFEVDMVRPTQLFGYRIELTVGERGGALDYWRSVDECEMFTFEGLRLEDLQISRGVAYEEPTVFIEQISLSVSSSPKHIQTHWYSLVNTVGVVVLLALAVGFV